MKLLWVEMGVLKAAHDRNLERAIILEILYSEYL